MKKFIAAFDGLNFSQSTLKYAVFLAKQCNAHLVGVFLDDFTRHSYGVPQLTNYEGEDFDKHLEEMNEWDTEERDRSVNEFEKECQQEGLNYSVRRDKNVALQDLLHESIYADLLIVSSSETLTRYKEDPPTRFIKDLLNDVQCPVLLVPKNYKPIGKFVILYDGEPSSVFAAKSFSYLFEPLKTIDTEVVTVKSQVQDLHVPDNKLIKEFIKRHYPKAEYIVLQGVPEDEIIDHVRRLKTESLIVLGAYRRNKVSRTFRPSMADYLLKYVNMALFIAHNKS